MRKIVPPWPWNLFIGIGFDFQPVLTNWECVVVIAVDVKRIFNSQIEFTSSRRLF